MMKIENPTRFVREMKGAPLSVVMLLAMTGLALSNSAICAGTGYSDKSVANALDYLNEIGMVVRSAGGWKVAEAVQLALPLVPPQIEEPVVEEVAEVENSDTECPRRKFSDSSLVVNSIKDIKELKELNDLTTINYLDLKPPESEFFRLNLEAFRESGISVTKKTRALAGKDYVDPLYILAHVEQAEREGQKVGLAIWRMQEGHERPLYRMTNGHFEGCKCNLCKYEFELEIMDDDQEMDWWLGNRAENS